MNPQNILLFQSRFSSDETEKAIDLLESKSARVSALIVKPKKGVLQLLQNDRPVYLRDNLLINNHLPNQNLNTDIPYRVLERALEDPSTADIVHRQFGPNLFNSKITLLNCLFNIHLLFRRHAISVCVSHVIPHNVVGWLCTVYCSYLGIEHYFMRESIIPDRAVLVRNGLNPEVLKKSTYVNQNHPEAASHIENALDSRQGQYNNFIPKDELERRLRERTFFRRLRGDLRQIAKRPKSAIPVYWKWKNRKALERLCSNDSIARRKPVIGFFLHYQPERTTFPEAKSFSQQFIMAKMLSQNAKEKGGTVIVKEHPSQILLASGTQFRDSGVYERYASLDSVQLAPPLSDPTEIIDNCDVIVSCGGSPLFEAIARGSPVIYFNRIPFVEMDGVFNVSSYEELDKAMDHIRDGEINMNPREIKESLLESFKETFSFDHSETGRISFDFFEFIGTYISTFE